MPGCDETRASRLHAHHVWHWADGGPTVIDNLTLLCRTHHRAVHTDGYRVRCNGDGSFTFLDPQGRLIPAVSTPPAHALPVPHVDTHTIPHWDGTPFDVAYVTTVLIQRRTWRRQQQRKLHQAQAQAQAQGQAHAA